MTKGPDGPFVLRRLEKRRTTRQLDVGLMPELVRCFVFCSQQLFLIAVDTILYKGQLKT